jgi:hypothetical protein
MATIDDLIRRAQELGYRGSDLYIPNVKYPHLRIRGKLAVFSVSSTGHKSLVDGAAKNVANARSVLPAAKQRHPDAAKLVQFIIDHR